jgi:hypothetical protein
LGPWLKIADFGHKLTAIASYARKCYDAMRKYFVRFFLVKKVEEFGSKIGRSFGSDLMLSDVACPRKLLLKTSYPNAANWGPSRCMSMVCMD